MNRDLLLADLERDEGWRAMIYGDGDGRQIVDGLVCHGVPTVGCGLTGPFTKDELMPITRSRAQANWETLVKAEPWVSDLTEPRQRALANLCFNLGPTKLLKFTQFLDFMRSGQFQSAAADLEGTLWASQVGERCARIVALIKGNSVDV